MEKLQEIYSEYVRMRTNGLDPKVVLHILRGYIEPLPKEQREDLIRRIRGWESTSAAAVTAPLKPVIKKLKTDADEAVTRTGVTPVSPAAPPPLPATEQPSVIKKLMTPPAQTPPPPVTASASPASEPAPAKPTEPDELTGQFDTRMLVDTSQRAHEDLFSADAALVLRVRGSDQVISLRPQDTDHELIIGRQVSGSVMTPDVDLAGFGADEMGVSRLHLALRYERSHEAVHVYDLGSANGSYINGQRLHPQEVRFLRDGDQLRLGRLVINVRFV